MGVKKKMLECVVAVGEGNGIGVHGGLPWYIPNDLKRFRLLTETHVVIMGFTTFVSLGCRPLPRRTNIVLTNKPFEETKKYQNVSFMNFEDCKNFIKKTRRRIFVIGGEQVYRLFEHYISLIHMTEVFHKAPIPFDAHFFNLSSFRLEDVSETFTQNECKYRYLTLIKELRT